jgi:hypothetical protein
MVPSFCKSLREQFMLPHSQLLLKMSLLQNQVIKLFQLPLYSISQKLIWNYCVSWLINLSIIQGASLQGHSETAPSPSCPFFLNVQMNHVQHIDIWLPILCSAAHLSTRHHDGSSINILWWKQHRTKWINEPKKPLNFKMKPKPCLSISCF